MHLVRQLVERRICELTGYFQKRNDLCPQDVKIVFKSEMIPKKVSYKCVLSASEFPTTITERQLLLAGLE
jgi:hypothetical protein